MIASSIIGRAPGTGAVTSRIGALLRPRWPMLVLALALWGVAWCSGADTNWVGRSRDEVVDQLGKPLSTLQRGDTEVLMYPESVRFEIRAGAVVGHRAGAGPSIVVSDGTRYTPTERGKVQRVAPTPPPEAKVAAAEAEIDDEPMPAPATQAAGVPDPAATEIADEEMADDAVIDPAADENETWKSQPTNSTMPQTKNLFATTPEEIAEHGMIPSLGREEEEKPEPAWVRPVKEIVGALLRFGLAFLILRIAISMVELPCYNPDVAKVAVLYVIVREGVHGLIRFGGHWEWIGLFRLDEGIGYLAMMYLLCKFKVALSGLTALKIATATTGATYLLMAILTIGLGFFLAGFY